MILWLNGTFGAGKTTTAGLVAQRVPRLRLFDPEHIGYMLRVNLLDHEVSDFQELRSWRVLTPVVIDEVARVTGQHLLVVQTVLVEDYWHELRSGLERLGHQIAHVVLEADEPMLRARIEADEVEVTARGWRLDHLARYAAARPWLTATAERTIDTTCLTPDQAANEVAEVFAARLQSTGRS